MRLFWVKTIIDNEQTHFDYDWFFECANCDGFLPLLSSIWWKKISARQCIHIAFCFFLRAIDSYIVECGNLVCFLPTPSSNQSCASKKNISLEWILNIFSTFDNTHARTKRGQALTLCVMLCTQFQSFRNNIKVLYYTLWLCLLAV